jgi:dihydrofolate reductase
MFKQKTFLKCVNLEGGESNNNDSDIIDEIFNRAGAYVMGKRMFEEGEANWPEDAPFRAPVFVLTHTTRKPWKRKGGTTFYFVNDEIDVALQKAKEAAGIKDVRISGGANTIQQYFNAGLIDEFSIHLAPILLCKGVRLFNKPAKHHKKGKFSLEISEVVNSPMVTHLFYKVKHNNQN